MKKYFKNIILIILLFIILVVCLFYKKKDNFVGHHFLNTNYEKTIYLVWRNKVDNNKTYEGFGDKLRGCIALYQYCKKNKINLKIDATDDICGDFLKNVTSPDYNTIKDKELIYIFNTNEELHNIVQKELSDKDTIYVYTINIANEMFEPDDYEFAKFFCEPKESIAMEVDKKLKELPEKFGIKHFRFIDMHPNVNMQDINFNDKIFQSGFDILKSNYKTTDVLFTTSNNFKEYAKQQLNIKTIECENDSCKLGYSAHIGYGKDYEVIKNTFIEFFIISHASYVESYNCYIKESGFVKWPCKIYNIPFTHIYIE